jgi:ATP-dependent DNA helicase RecG
MSQPAFDITPFLHQDEGQHFDRKSLFEGPEGAKRARDRRAVRDQVAEYVAGFANAEGGVLVLGIEDDHTVTGHSLPTDALANLLATPRARLQPAQAEGFIVEANGRSLVVFDVPAADVPVQVIGDGFPLRIGDKTLQVSETQIRALKLQGLAESWESRPSACTLADLDPALIARARQGAGLAAWTDEDYLLKRKLADRRGDRLQLRHAAELLFAKPGPDHPNAGVRIFRVIGTERRTGPEHNVEERPRIEGNLPGVLEEAGATVGGLLRRPSRLVGTHFRPVPEYPEFSWKEALLNAVAHRDYGVEGAGTEIWLFEDRMEITSPGGLVGDLTLNEVLSLKRIHRSRNPRLMRVLVDLGVARDQGEGIPRMFAEMEDAFLPKPEIAASPRTVTITLRNTPTLTAADRDFVSRLGSTEISDEEFRALLHAHRNGRVENADLRTLAGMDTLTASLLLRKLRDRSLLDLHPHGANSYYTLPSALSGTTERGEPVADRGEPDVDRGERRPDRGEPATDSGERPTDRGEPSPEISALISQLGSRPRKARLRAVIEAICSQRPWTTPGELGRWLNIQPANLSERHLSPMVRAGQLERRYPDTPTHAEQAYRSTGMQLPFGHSGEDRQ